MAKPKRKAMTNDEALDRLEAAGYKSSQFHLEGMHGYFVPLQLWSEHVGRFNSGFKYGARVQLNVNSTRKIGRRFGMAEIHAMTKNLGIGNGNTYQLDSDHRIEVTRDRWPYRKSNVADYKQPIEVGKQFITNIIQAHRQAKRDEREGYMRLSTQYIDVSEDIKNNRWEDINIKIANGNWPYTPIKILPDDYFEKVVLQADGVLHHIKQPYGHISGVYVHFMSTWKSKREARYHVTFDHGARVIITNDWITRSYSTTCDMGSRLYVCNKAGQTDACKICDERMVHKHDKFCEQTECAMAGKGTFCVPVQDYERQNVGVVYKGPGFCIPTPELQRKKYDPNSKAKALEKINKPYFGDQPVTTVEEMYALLNALQKHSGGK
jgi:hypothetical protein